jgi:hypothetical protein
VGFHKPAADARRWNPGKILVTSEGDLKKDYTAMSMSMEEQFFTLFGSSARTRS